MYKSKCFVGYKLAALIGRMAGYSLARVYLVPDTVLAHWIYLVAVALVLVCGYVVFMKRYYHLHAEYLESLKK